MRVVVQRVKEASCIVNERVVSSIKYGFMLLVGFSCEDTINNVEKMAKKISSLRIFDDENGKINLNIHDAGGEILSISQFTLYADTKKSNRPSFSASMPGEQAKVLYEYFNSLLEEKYQLSVQPGVFGAHMYLDIICDGPVTITLEE